MRKNFWKSIGGATSVAAILTGVAVAAPPPADTRIGNQAAATFESNGETFTVQSNLVETIVNEVFGLELTNDQTKPGSPGGIVTFPHTITNNGNTDDIFDLVTSAAGGTDDFPLTNIVIYPDADQDGVPDSLTPITATPAILAGGSYGVVVQATVPGTAAATEVTDFTLTATSQSDPAESQTNTDIVSITNDGILDVQKDQSLVNDADGDGVYSIGDTVEVTLSYSNIGIGTATDVIIVDDLPTTDTSGNPVTLTYEVGSGAWSDAPGISLSDTDDGNEETNAQGTSIDFEFNSPGTITTKFDTLAPGRSGEVTFNYIITDAQVGTFENIATFETNTQAPTPSNPSPITVSPTADFVLADAVATSSTPAGGVDGSNLNSADPSTSDDDGAADDVVTDADDLYVGQSTTFDFVLSNLGNAADVFALDVANTDFPAGTTFEIVDADGVTPIIGDEVFVAAGEERHVQVVARIPVTATPTAGPANFDAVLTATSTSDSSLSNESTLTFAGELLAPPIDLANSDGAGTQTGGTGIGAVTDAGNPWETESALPGETVVFPLSVTVDAGAPSNSFDLAASTDDTFGSLTLPDGWTVEFYDQNGNLITNTGVLSPTATDDAVFEYEARVTIPEGAPPIDGTGQEIYFQVESPLNGASDTILNSVIVEEVIDLEIESNQQIQAAPGGVVAIPHTITNLGNVPITGGAITVGGSDPFDSGLTSELYYDANGDGVLDPTDPLITDISDIPGGILPGETEQVFVRVQTPAGSTFGISESGDVTIGSTLSTPDGTVTDSDPSNNTVTDTVTIISGDVEVEKLAAIDVECDGSPDTSFSASPQNADPGACIVYQITADNTGTNVAENVVLNDAIPNYTTVEICNETAGAVDCSATLVVDGATSTPGLVPADEAAGLLSSSATPGVGYTLDPGSRSTLTFTVQIDE